MPNNNMIRPHHYNDTITLATHLKEALSMPPTLGQIDSSPREVLRANLSQLKTLARNRGANFWQLHNALGVSPREYKKPSGQRYKMLNERGLVRALWQPDDDKEALIKKLKRELKQSSVPTNKSVFFYSDKVTQWLRENNFHDLSHFSEYFNVPLIFKRGERRAQYSPDFDSLAHEIWPAQSVAELLKAIKKQESKRPVNLQVFFKSDNTTLMRLLKKNGFPNLIDFFRYVGVVKQDKQTTQDSERQRDPVIDFQLLATKVWVKPAKAEIVTMINQSGAKHKPSDLHDFFSSRNFQDWLATNGFTSLTDLSRHLGIKVRILESKGKQKAARDYKLLSDLLWAKRSPTELTVQLHQDLGQVTRPAKPQEFFTSQEFRNWLTENNFDSLVEFARHYGAQILRKQTKDTGRDKPRNKLVNYINYDSLARKIWKVPDIKTIKKEMKVLSGGIDLKDLTSPYRFFTSTRLKQWLQQNNFKDLVHFCEVIRAPMTARPAADRNTERVVYNWEAMIKKLS
ncbi:MAG: hypothetical protein O2962_09015 [Cyanobacteria bacterium]|nr:hypothetical protein [Cyanobacteriota bacterium]